MPMKPPSLPTPAAAGLLAAALLAASASPALAVTPFKMRVPIGPIATAASVPDISIAGYNPLTSLFQSPSGSFTWDGASYTVPTGTAFSFTGPVTLTLALTADGVKATLRDNPLLLPGTLAGGYLTGEGFGYTDGQWTVPKPQVLAGEVSCRESPNYQEHCGATYWSTHIGRSFLPGYAYPSGCTRAHTEPTPPYEHHLVCSSPAPEVPTPATADDWAALPDPLPAVGAELPYAPYLPAVAVQNNFTINDLNTGTVHHCTNGGCD